MRMLLGTQRLEQEFQFHAYLIVIMAPDWLYALWALFAMEFGLVCFKMFSLRWSTNQLNTRGISKRFLQNISMHCFDPKTGIVLREMQITQSQNMVIKVFFGLVNAYRTNPSFICLGYTRNFFVRL
jgi:hypothetical protein